MNASCLDEKGRFKSCPYRVYTDEHNCLSHTGRNAPVVACELENEVSNARSVPA